MDELDQAKTDQKAISLEGCAIEIRSKENVQS